MAFNFSMFGEEPQAPPQPVGTTGRPGFNFSMFGEPDTDPTQAPPPPDAAPSIWERIAGFGSDVLSAMDPRPNVVSGAADAQKRLIQRATTSIIPGLSQETRGRDEAAGFFDPDVPLSQRLVEGATSPLGLAMEFAGGAAGLRALRRLPKRGAPAAAARGAAVLDEAAPAAKFDPNASVKLGPSATARGAEPSFNFSMLDEGSVPLAKVDPDAATTLGPGAYAGPERRATPRADSPAKSLEDIDYERVRQQQAQGVLKQNAARGQEKQALDEARAAAAAERGEAPLPRFKAPAQETPPPVQETPLSITPEQRAPLNDPSRVATRAQASGESMPAQQPLSAERKAGDEVFISKQPEPLQEGLRDIVEQNHHFEAQRRGVQPIERTNALARYVQIERQKVLPKGTALNAEETKAYANNLASVTDRIDEISKRIVAGESSAADRAALEMARIEQHALLASAMGARAETGRALNIHKQFAQIFQSKDALAIEQAMKIPGLNLDEVATKLATFGTDAEKLDYLRSLQKISPLDTARAVYYANILSGVRTHIRNIFGNTVNGAFNMASGVAATGYDLAKSTVTGAPRTMFFGELKPRAVGAVMGVKQGLDDALFTIKHGYTPKQLGTFDVPRPELPGGAKNPFNLVGRTLEAEDQLFYGINYNMELYGRLYAKARGQGTQGAKLADQVAAWKLNPPRDVAEAAEKAALHAVFKEDPGKWTAAIMGLKKEIPFLDFVMPFVKTPANILRQGIEATPAAFLTKQTRDAFNAGGRQQAEVMGRITAGTTALTALAYWASQGKISGTGPSDAEERAALMESGWRPNSLKIGDTWVSFSEIQPLAQPLYAMANAWDQYHAGEGVSVEKILGSMGKAIVDQSFFSGVSDLNNALSDPDRYSAQFLQRMSQGAVPFSGLQRNIAQAIDTTVRQPKNVTEGIKAVVPGLSKTVDPRLDRLGQDVERSGGAAVQLTPFNVGRPSTDPVIQELTRLKVNNLGLPPKKLPATKNSPALELTIAERRQMGAAVREALERMFRQPTWQAQDEDRARDRITDAVRRARTQTIARIRAARRRSSE